MKDHILFIQHINDHYDHLKYKFYNFCKLQHYAWSEDIYSDTILKCYEAIEKKGKLSDTSAYGIESYLFKAFKNNLMNEKRYCRNKNRDYNITSDNIHDIYEVWFNNNNTSEKEKLINDLFKDFAILYIMKNVEDAFDDEHFYLFRLKTLIPDMTFKKLAEKTRIKSSRKKVITVQRWVKQNITKEEIRKAFHYIYGDLL